MRDLSDIVATRVRQVRNARGWTQEDLSDKVGLSVRYIGQIERNRASPSVRVLGRLSQALGVDPAELLTREPLASRQRGRR
jgi:transcriptional regulator with XRE-family HTH domain